ncbi:hypothetical protein, partial [Thiolapillus sp.]|uniref:hypothetical protein n=1 Tax=Thiolapillus sp. TaxID=2017437 RepID=UPI003AF4F8AA
TAFGCLLCFPSGAMRTTGKQCGLAATGGYQPSLRSPWLAAWEILQKNAKGWVFAFCSYHAFPVVPVR